MTYTYKCINCGEFEVEQSIKDEALTTCPKCNGKVHRVITGGTGIIFKAGGFYSSKEHDNDDRKNSDI